MTTDLKLNPQAKENDEALHSVSFRGIIDDDNNIIPVIYKRDSVLEEESEDVAQNMHDDDDDGLSYDHDNNEETISSFKIETIKSNETKSNAIKIILSESGNYYRRAMSKVHMKVRNRALNIWLTLWGWIKHPYEAFVDLMYHLFDKSFAMLVVYFTVMFYIWCILGAVVIYCLGLIEPECLVFDGLTLDEVDKWVNACWTLSWTTFSTTGYGNTAPAPSLTDNVLMDGVEQCIAINTLLMIISFIGIVYAGSAAAILYSKLEKIKAQAQVSFTDICVIRFGSGLKRLDTEEEYDSEDEQGCLCPVLEFRILNQNHERDKGVIINSEIHCVASVEDEFDISSFSTLRMDIPLNNIDSQISPVGTSEQIFLPKRRFIGMNLINGENPFFRKCWTATHIIDANSPLIRKSMRDKISKNNGFWPMKYNNATSIKRSLRFARIIVNFTGVATRISKEVHSQHIYDIQDILVGYQFENIHSKVDNDNVVVRSERLNDITEQNGSDRGEPLDDIVSKRQSIILDSYIDPQLG